MSALLTVNIASALNCEAKAVVDRFKLKKRCDKPFTLFEGGVVLGGHDVVMRALISGVGATNMATAVGWCAAQPSNNGYEDYGQQAWLNLGIAGHGQFKLGDGFIVSVSQDQISNKLYYPPQIARRPVRLSACMSLNAPSTDYPDVGAIDMEASAFFNAATCFAESECVQSYKVVSDTPEHSLENLNAAGIHTLLQAHTPDIENYLSSLTALLRLRGDEMSANEVVSTMLNQIVPRLRTSHSQRQQCERLAAQLSYVLSNEQLEQVCGSLGKSSDIDSALAVMEGALNSIEPILGCH